MAQRDVLLERLTPMVSQIGLQRKPNLILFLPDQQRADTIACYGGKKVHASNLNKLAAESVVFERAYVTHPVCTPSRSSLMTGTWPHINGCTRNSVALDRRFRSFAELIDDKALEKERNHREADRKRDQAQVVLQRFELSTVHALMTAVRPKKPCGRTRRTSPIKTKGTATFNSAPTNGMNVAINDSATPITRPPTIAPIGLSHPPSVAADSE